MRNIILDLDGVCLERRHTYLAGWALRFYLHLLYGESLTLVCVDKEIMMMMESMVMQIQSKNERAMREGSQ